MSVLRVPPRDLTSRIFRTSRIKSSTRAARSFELNAETDALLQNGFQKSPFAATPAIAKYVKDIFEEFSPKTELDKAAILLASFLPYGQRLEVGNKTYFGREPMNLQIRPLIAAISSKHEILCPDELLQLIGREGTATDFEYHMLLLTMLRAAGIKSSLQVDERSYVTRIFVHLSDGNRYSLDIRGAEFSPIDKETIPKMEVEALGWFFYIKGQIAFLQFEERRSQGEIIDLEPFAQKAINYTQAALTLRPDLFGAWYCLGATYRYQRKENEANDAFAKGKYHEAMFYLDRREGSLISEALEHLNDAVGHNPAFPQAWLEMGKLLHQLGSQDEANLCLDKAWRHIKSEADADAIELKAEINLYKGLVMERQALLVDQELGEGFDNFIEVLEKSSITFTEKDMAYNPVIGRADNFDQHRLERAIEYYEEAIKLRPDYSLALTSKGQALLKLNRGEEAKATLIQAVKGGLGNPLAWLLLGLTYLEYLPGENREKERKIAGACFKHIFFWRETISEFTKSLLLLAINYASLNKKEEASICLDVISKYGGKEFASRAWKIRAIIAREKKAK